jgi:hypothetical protein
MSDLNNTFEVLDRATIDGVEWVLAKTRQLKHPKNGKPNLHIAVTYSVERTDRALDAEFKPISENRQRFWLTSKLDATSYFKSLTNNGKVVERSGAHALNRIFGF